ncbi:unnamed protein product [Hermetia illucens]|uniref:Uncharacterized protein n=1 Tax=Hermetia illucens TaxID=343691 RepID=A0A7R8UCJ4_HERIL|nr:unnamed protein product [Hermetia illucens]
MNLKYKNTACIHILRFVCISCHAIECRFRGECWIGPRSCCGSVPRIPPDVKTTIRLRRRSNRISFEDTADGMSS